MDFSPEVSLFCGVFKFNGRGMDLNMNPLILRLTGLWYGPHKKWTLWQNVLYGLWTLWMLSMLFGLMVMGASAAYVYRDDLVAIASNTCLFVQDIGAFIKALMFVSRRGVLLRVLRRLDALAFDPVVMRGGAANRATIARAARKATVVTAVFLIMGFVTYVAWMVTPALLGTGLSCWAALRSESPTFLPVQITTVGVKSSNRTLLLPKLDDAGEVDFNSGERPLQLEAAAGGQNDRWAPSPSQCPPPTLPAEGWFFFDFFQNPGYAVAYVIQIFCVFYMYIITSVIDTLFVSMMIYISALLRVLATDLSTLRQKARKDFDTRNTKQREFRSVRSGAAADEERMELALVGAIEFHQRIVHAVDEMQAVTSGPVLVQFVISTSVMCLALFATTASGGNHASTIKFAAYLATLFSQLLLYCWFGDEVTQMNEEVVLAAYGSSWFDGSQEFKKRVLFIILRAQRTLAFRGGAFYELSRNTFLYIVNASYSFFNLLMQVQD